MIDSITSFGDSDGYKVKFDDISPISVKSTDSTAPLSPLATMSIDSSNSNIGLNDLNGLNGENNEPKLFITQTVSLSPMSSVSTNSNQLRDVNADMDRIP